MVQFYGVYKLKEILHSLDPCYNHRVNQFLTKSEAAEQLGVSIGVITRLANRGEIRTEQIGKRLMIPGDALEEYFESSNRIRVPDDKARSSNVLPKLINLSFFSGAGGLDIGLEREGFESIFFCENYREARMTIAKNRPDAGLAGDIALLDGETVRDIAGIGSREIDVMAGGPPCQAFSTAGARRAFNDPRGNVFLKYIDLAAELKPRYLVIENVRGLLSTPYPLVKNGPVVKGGALQQILIKLKEAGYQVSFNLYNAANFGAAQIRERVILIGKREGSAAPWLTPTHSNDLRWQEEFGLKPWKTFRDVVSTLPADVEHIHTQFPEKRLRYFRLLNEGQCWTSLPEALKPEALGKAFTLPGGKTGFYRRLSFDRPSPTLVTSPTMPATDLCHPTELRPLSIQEYKAIQGFPQDWWIGGSITDVYKQIGNAVPVELGRAIGRTLRDDMAGVAANPAFENFPYSRYHRTNQLTWAPQA